MAVKTQHQPAGWMARWQRLNLHARQFLLYFLISFQLYVTALLLFNEEILLMTVLAGLIHWLGIKLVDFYNPYNRLWKSLLVGIAFVIGVIFTGFFMVIVFYGILRCTDKYYHLDPNQIVWAGCFYVLSILSVIIYFLM